MDLTLYVMKLSILLKFKMTAYFKIFKLYLLC